MFLIEIICFTLRFETSDKHSSITVLPLPTIISKWFGDKNILIQFRIKKEFDEHFWGYFLLDFFFSFLLNAFFERPTLDRTF